MNAENLCPRSLGYMTANITARLAMPAASKEESAQDVEFKAVCLPIIPPLNAASAQLLGHAFAATAKVVR